MDYKTNDIIKSLEELTLVYNNNIDCGKNPKLCNYGILLSQTINKTILFLESQNQKNNTTYKNKIVAPDININYEQLSKFNNCKN
jgi:hypothetical protein